MSEIAYSARGTLSEHSHEHAHLCFVLQGTYIESDGKQEMQCLLIRVIFPAPSNVSPASLPSHIEILSANLKHR